MYVYLFDKENYLIKHLNNVLGNGNRLFNSTLLNSDIATFRVEMDKSCDLISANFVNPQSLIYMNRDVTENNFFEVAEFRKAPADLILILNSITKVTDE